MKMMIRIIGITGLVLLTVACSSNSERSAKLDACYEKYGCNNSSWISSALGGTKVCNQCNSEYLRGSDEETDDNDT
jgi:Na+-transporting NADH:ubiquinone oxidoreductase subunit NqrF